jgi:hypothetical protein
MAVNKKRWVRYDNFGRPTQDVVLRATIPKTGRWKDVPLNLYGPIQTAGGGIVPITLATVTTTSGPGACDFNNPMTKYSILPVVVGSIIYDDPEGTVPYSLNNFWIKHISGIQSLQINLEGVVLDTEPCPDIPPAIVTGVTDGTPLEGLPQEQGQVDSVVTYEDTPGLGLLLYGSDDVNVVTVHNTTGLATYQAAGTAIITARSFEDLAFSGTTAVTVNAPPVVVTDVTPGTALVGVVLGTGQVDSVVEYESTVGTGVLTYLSQIPGIATVDAAGLVTYVGPGSTEIIATSVENGSFSAPTLVTVSV